MNLAEAETERAEAKAAILRARVAGDEYGETSAQVRLDIANETIHILTEAEL